jgi:hypothetical protein
VALDLAERHRPSGLILEELIDKAQNRLETRDRLPSRAPHAM